MHGDPIERDADKKAADQDRRQSKIRRYAESAGDQIKRHHAGDDHGAVGEIDHVHDAPNKGKPHRRQSIDQPDQDAINDRSDYPEHARLEHASVLLCRLLTGLSHFTLPWWGRVGQRRCAGWGELFSEKKNSPPPARLRSRPPPARGAGAIARFSILANALPAESY